MKTYFRVLIGVMLGLCLLEAAAFEKEATFKSGSVLISAKRPLSTGLNVLVLSISKDKKAMENSKVSVKVFMPAMPGMPAMESLADARPLGDGKYEVEISLAMGGTWQMHIFITPEAGKKQRIKTSFDF